jgi:glutaminyl-peptide cyclotransferase
MRLAGAAIVLMVGCFQPAGSNPPKDDPDGGEEQQQLTPFAIDRAPGKGEQAVAFNGKRALGYLEEICAIGPRMSGTAGMRKQIDLLKKHFEKFGGKIEEQKFQAKQISRQNPVEMTNLIVSWQPEQKRRVILCCHYDTRPIADEEEDPRKWRETFISANDGGSGVALLMELAQHMKDIKTNVGVDFVFFDGEEYIFDRKRDKYFFGSEHFANTWQKTKNRPQYGGAILLDMIAGKNARFPVEEHSWMRARPLVEHVWAIAAELKIEAFQKKIGDRVLDDHISLLAVGIPAIDIIDFSYPHWHRLSDVPDNCSAESIDNVARVLMVWLQRLK